ncbi:MAG: hypothetical protein M1839_003503 [Geoglossum umbratile]|nr:MAG: hypothetical protein M1839_003503 [Geoglossum umbratile]
MLPKAHNIDWQPAKPVTVVAATVVVIVDRVAHTSRTTTITNAVTELSENGNTRPIPPKNSGGTIVTTVTVSDSIAHTQFTTVVAYPTRFLIYDYNYLASGTLQTTATNGAKGCLTLSDGSHIPLPSHPPWPKPFESSIPEQGDDVGTNFLPQWEDAGLVDFLFPDVGAFKTCALEEVAPAVMLFIATVLTETSTSYMDGNTAAGSSEQLKETGPPPSPPPNTPAPQPILSNSGSNKPGPQPPTVTPITGVAPSPPAITVGGQVIHPDSSYHYIIGTQTLTPGGLPITVSGSTISVPAFTAPILTQAISADSQSHLIVGSQTLAPGGPAITVSGTPVSVQKGGTSAVIGTSTVGIGDLIISGFGSIVAPGSTNTASGGYSGPPSNGGAGGFAKGEGSGVLAAGAFVSVFMAMVAWA